MGCLPEVYVLIRDETDYNGCRTIDGVYASEIAAQKSADASLAHIKSDPDAVEKGWIPQFSVEYAVFIDE